MTDDLDETLEESFPASDAPANTPETGIGVDGSSSDAAVPAGSGDEDKDEDEVQPAAGNGPA